MNAKQILGCGQTFALEYPLTSELTTFNPPTHIFASFSEELQLSKALWDSWQHKKNDIYFYLILPQNCYDLPIK